MIQEDLWTYKILISVFRPEDAIRASLLKEFDREDTFDNMSVEMVG